MTPLLTNAMRLHPAWTSWVKLVELYSVFVKHELSVSNIEQLDDLQVEYMRMFDQVPEFVGLKRPKHHFLTHVSHDAWHFGPPHGYWCFGFEAFLKRLSSAGKSAQTSEGNPCRSCKLQYYADWTARNLSAKQSRVS